VVALKKSESFDIFMKSFPFLLLRYLIFYFTSTPSKNKKGHSQNWRVLSLNNMFVTGCFSTTTFSLETQ